MVEQRASRRTRREPQSPQYVARAKVGNGWTNIGAAWPLRSGEEGLSIQLTTIPLNWDGRFVLLPPLEQTENHDLRTSEVRDRGNGKQDDEIPF